MAEGLPTSRLIAEQLADNDRIRFMRPSWNGQEQWRELVWNEGGSTWRDSQTGLQSEEPFGLAMAFQIVDKAEEALPAKITFLGWVPSRSVGALVFGSWFDTYDIAFGYPFPVSTTLKDIPFLDSGATGSDIPNNADYVKSWDDVEEAWKTVYLGLQGQWWLYQPGNPEAPENLLDLPPGQGYEYHTTYVTDETEEPLPEHRHYKTMPVTRPYRR